jgi:hypothetical protein
VRIDGTTAGVSIALATAAPTLDTVRTRAVAELDLAGFESRRVSGNGGKFITATEIEQQNPSRLSQVLTGVPGIIVARDTRSTYMQEMNVISHRSLGSSPLNPQGCEVSFFVDGMLVPDGAKEFMGPGGIDVAVLPRDVLGIELYLGFANVPPAFQRSKSGCGTVLIWTKRRDSK